MALEPFAFPSVAGHSDLACASRADFELESARGARSPAKPRFSASHPRALRVPDRPHYSWTAT